jgi:hypothetical protein
MFLAGDPNFSLVPIEKFQALTNVTYTYMICVLLLDIPIRIKTDTVVAYADYQAVAGNKYIDSDIPVTQLRFQAMSHGILDKRLNDKLWGHHILT